MTDRSTRRTFLRAATAAGVGALSGCAAFEWGDSEAIDVRGAIYMPTRAFNWYQMWRWYDPGVVERDLGYATRVNLNALRVCLNYERWTEDRTATRGAFDHMLAAAARRDVKILVGLFESVGFDPNWRNLRNDDPVTAVPVQSPSRDILRTPSRWREPRAFVEWFAERYGDDDRLLAVEVMNEPGWLPFKEEFARSMFFALRTADVSVPLTVGSTSLANDAEYADWGADVLQFHYNFASSRADFRDALEDGRALSDALDRPVWLTEWQRRRSGEGFRSAVRGDEWQPNYSSLAPAVRDAGVGNFFWSLMVKPAYVRFQRDQGVLSGLFHEDGAVWSAADARAIAAMSGEGSFSGRERPEWPSWASEVKANAFGDA